MIQINVVPGGFLEIPEQPISFKIENQFYRFAEISAGRSTTISVPVNETNIAVFRNSNEAGADGAEMRYRYYAQLIADGASYDGTLVIQSATPSEWRCYWTDVPEWFERLQDKPLSECAVGVQPVMWRAYSSDVLNVASYPPSSSRYAGIYPYDDGVTHGARWQYAPSVHVQYFIDDVLKRLSIPHVISLPEQLWMTAGSMNGGGTESTDVRQADSATVMTGSDNRYFEGTTVQLSWATTNFPAYIGGGTSTAGAFKAMRDVKITFGESVANGVYLCKWAPRLGQCETLGGKDSSGRVVYDGSKRIEPLDGRTIEVKKGTILFFTSKKFSGGSDGQYYFGWKSIKYPFTITFTTSGEVPIQLGESWHLQNNMPDMTLFECLKSVANVSGCELRINAGGVYLQPNDATIQSDTKELHDVISIDEVTRNVAMWGDDTSEAVVEFDSESYVTDKLQFNFNVDNALLTGEKSVKIGFSEGNVSDTANAVKIQDCNNTSQPYKFVGKKWTIVRYLNTSKIWARVVAPDRPFYDVIGSAATCVKARCKMGLVSFIELRDSTILLHQGVLYIWTSATYTDGIVTLTMQKISG